MFSVNSSNIINDLRFLSGLFEFSNLEKDHELYIERNEKVVFLKFKLHIL